MVKRRKSKLRPLPEADPVVKRSIGVIEPDPKKVRSKNKKARAKAGSNSGLVDMKSTNRKHTTKNKDRKVSTEDKKFNELFLQRTCDVMKKEGIREEDVARVVLINKAVACLKMISKKNQYLNLGKIEE
jgi:hypothetical protein